MGDPAEGTDVTHRKPRLVGLLATACTTLVLLPGVAAAAPAPVAPTLVGNLQVCARGGPAFARVLPRDDSGAPAGPAMSIGVQDGGCTTVAIAPGRVWVYKLSSSASSKFCGPAAGNSCFGEQAAYDEVSWSDVYGSGRTGGNDIEVVVAPPGGPVASVTFWSGSSR